MSLITTAPISRREAHQELVQVIQYCLIAKDYINPFHYNLPQLQAWTGTFEGEGNPTREAIRRFQADRPPLWVTGTITEETALALLSFCHSNLPISLPPPVVTSRELLIPGTNLTWGKVIDIIISEIPRRIADIADKAVDSVSLIVRTVNDNTRAILRTLAQ